MSFTPKALPRTSQPQEIVDTTNINFALLQQTIDKLDNQVRALNNKSAPANNDDFNLRYIYTVMAGNG